MTAGNQWVDSTDTSVAVFLAFTGTLKLPLLVRSIPDPPSARPDTCHVLTVSGRLSRFTLTL
jgi:hypothetical protein